MPRHIPEQLRASIIDRSASLFARQGFRATSLQQIADTVGYTKAGILHHFTDKQAIYDAGVAAVVEHTDRVTRAALTHKQGVERDTALLAGALEMTYNWPGIAQLSLNLANQDDPLPEGLLRAAQATAAAFGITPDVDNDRAMRVLTATFGLTYAAITSAPTDPHQMARPLIMKAAMDALGHTLYGHP